MLAFINIIFTLFISSRQEKKFLKKVFVHGNSPDQAGSNYIHLSFVSAIRNQTAAKLTTGKLQLDINYLTLYGVTIFMKYIMHFSEYIYTDKLYVIS